MKTSAQIPRNGQRAAYLSEKQRVRRLVCKGHPQVQKQYQSVSFPQVCCSKTASSGLNTLLLVIIQWKPTFYSDRASISNCCLGEVGVRDALIDCPVRHFDGGNFKDGVGHIFLRVLREFYSVIRCHVGDVLIWKFTSVKLAC